MWVIDNNTPLAVDRAFLRDRQGGEVWIGVIKGTFDVAPNGSLRVAAEQPPPARVAVWSGEPGQSSLLHDTDFVLARSGTDVLVHGNAYAPRGQRVPAVDVALKVGAMVKRLRVHGVRAWMTSYRSSAIVPGPARPFDKIPITYENAFGGTDPDAPAGKPTCSMHNPVGRGFTHDPKKLVDRAAPQVESPDTQIEAGPNNLRPAGLGPIASSWMPRVGLAGTYDKDWEANQSPLLPKDFDDRFWRSAPADQQLAHPLGAGQSIELYSMTADGYWRVRVPDLSFRLRVIFTDGEERTQAALHTVLLWPESRRVQFVWHSSLPCHGREHKLTRAIVNWEGDRACLSPSTSTG
jgi:hypothetical protein